MQIISALFGASVITILYYGAIHVLDEKLSLMLFRKGKIITDRLVMAVAVMTFCGWCYLGSSNIFYQNLFEMFQLMISILAMSILAVTDAKVKLIPNCVLLIFMGLWVMIDGVAVIYNPEAGLALLEQSIIGGIVGGAIFLLCYLLSKRQLGAGDVKLAFVMGIYLTGQRIIGALAYGVLLCGIYSLVQLARKKITMKDGIPLVPFLYMGVFITLMVL